MPYGLFDYTPGSTIHTMGLSPAADRIITKAAICSEDPRFCPGYKPPCPQAMPLGCPSGQESFIQGYRDIPGCPKIPMYACRPKQPVKPSCPTTLTQGKCAPTGCNYKLV